jgi:hypothetical protein
MTLLNLRLVAIAAALLFATAASADECDSKATEVAGKIGGTVSPRWQIGIAIEHPSVNFLAVMCEDHKAIGAMAESREKIPTAEYYETVGRFVAAAFPPITPQEASSELLKCQTMALPKEPEWALTKTKGLQFQCRLSDSDGLVMVAYRAGMAPGLK